MLRWLASFIVLFVAVQADAACAPNYKNYVGSSGSASLQYNFGVYVNNIVEYNRQITCLNSQGGNFAYNTDSKSYGAFLHFFGLGPAVGDYKATLTNVVNAKRAMLGPDATNVDVARAALGDIVSRRDEPGMSTDPALRDAEYALRNYIGAQVLTGHGGATTLSDAYQDVVFQNPAATGAYNAWKSVTNAIGVGAVNQATAGNPNSPPGGFDAASEAYLNGLTNQPVESLFNYAAPQPVGTGLTLAAPTPVALPPSSAFYLASVAADAFSFFDPKMTNDFDIYVGAGPLIRELLLPAQAGLAAQYQIVVDGNYYLGQAGVAFNLLPFYPYGANVIQLRNLCAATGCSDADLVFGLKFATSGIAAFTTSAASTGTTAVPEPAAWMTMLVGFALLGSRLRRRSGTPATPPSAPKAPGSIDISR